jgi:hypothetical protein
MVYYFKRIPLFTVAAGLLFLFSCKDPNTVGMEVLPANDQLNVVFSDTVSLTTLTVPEDSLATKNLSSNLAGTYVDPYFGICRGSFYSQLLPLKLSPNFGIEPQADSVILALTYTGSYGDTTSSVTVLPQQFNVYQLAEDLHRDSTYYSNRKPTISTLIGSYIFTPNVKDSVLVNGKMEAPQLRIQLDTSFFRTYILNQTGQATLSSVTAFQAYFKGIYVTPDTLNNIGNRILYFNLAAETGITRLHIYYHNATDTGVYDMSIDTKTSCAAVNNFYHNYTGTPVENQLNDSIAGANEVYLQAMAGLKTKIKFPYLKNYSNVGRISINKAELVITVDDSKTNGYAPVDQLAVQGIDADGNGIFTSDFVETPGYRGGVFNTTTKEYSTNISRYVQEVLTGDADEYGLYLVVYGGAIFANRSVLFGGGPLLPSRMKLQITYTLLN